MSKRNSAKSQSNFVRFIFLTGLGGILILILMFVILFSAITKEDNNVKNEDTILEDKTSLEDETKEELEELKEEKEEIIGLVIKPPEDNSITVLNVEDEQEIILKIEIGTEMKDVYGNAMSLKEFQVGDIIKTKYNKTNMEAEFLRISGEAWEKKTVTDVKINLENNTIQIGNDLYEYTDNLISIYRGENISLDKILPVDEITLRGYKDKVWFLNVDKSHGYISVISSDTDEGTVEIDNNIYMAIKEVKDIPITEGSHKIVIKKDNYEPLVENIQLDYMQTLEISLDNMKKKVGNLIVKANNVSDYKVFIDDVEYPGEQSILLEYGQYHVVVQKEGYKDWNKDITLDQDSIVINVELEKEDIPKTAEVSINTNPEGADVYIDDMFMGISPIEIDLSYGEHKITIKKEEYNPLSISINIEENQKKRNFIFTLQKISEMQNLE
ncbi:PEGA domain-containing protein [Defluviitalea phaphyphila]|uniref:PEGA domain-containing protein n=1 Tax=Defluviitalea phaphyphila TaxID=1473580 RepID=UPI000731ACD5|nr:PEGA domain-containing protein [Defluviitalea phaphyphila]